MNAPLKLIFLLARPLRFDDWTIRITESHNMRIKQERALKMLESAWWGAIEKKILTENPWKFLWKSWPLRFYEWA
jgi:hypothetical protein